MDAVKTTGSARMEYNSTGATTGKESIPFTVKGPIPVRLSEATGDQYGRTGCSLLELIFQYPSQVGELVFSNYYTAWMSIFVKRMPSKGKGLCGSEKERTAGSGIGVPRTKPALERSFSIDVPGSGRYGSKPSLTPVSPIPGSSRKAGLLSRRPSTASTTADDDLEFEEASRIESMGMGILKQLPSTKRRHNSGSLSSEMAAAMETRPWELSIEMKKLMLSPHYEAGSQDLVSIPATESMIDWRDVIVMRLVLHQPSTVWKRFAIEEVNVFRQLPKRGFSHSDDIVRQRDNWFSVLKMNTKAVLAGQVVEPECAAEDGTGR